MGYSYVIKSVEQSDGKFNVCYNLLKDGLHVIGDSVIIQANDIAKVASDGRNDYIKDRVAYACKKHMVVQDVKVDISQLVGTEVSLDPVKYETKAELEAKSVISEKALA
jgi:hypothetical protein